MKYITDGYLEREVSMANMNRMRAAGGLLSGVIQGLNQAKSEKQQMEHQKELLKLEQDKLKLVEREQDLTSDARQKNMLLDAFKEQQLNEYRNQQMENERRKLAAEADKPVTVGQGQAVHFPVSGKVIRSKYAPSRSGDGVPSSIQEVDYIVSAANKRGIQLNPDEVMMKIKQGGAGMGLAEKAELSLLPWMLLGKSAEVKAIVKELKAREEGGAVEAPTGGDKEDWRNYLGGK